MSYTTNVSIVIKETNTLESTSSKQEDNKRDSRKRRVVAELIETLGTMEESGELGPYELDNYVELETPERVTLRLKNGERKHISVDVENDQISFGNEAEWRIIGTMEADPRIFPSPRYLGTDGSARPLELILRIGLNLD